MSDRTLTVAFIGFGFLFTILAAVYLGAFEHPYADFLDKALILAGLLTPSPLSKSSTATDQVQVVNNPDDPIPVEDV